MVFLVNIIVHILVNMFWLFIFSLCYFNISLITNLMLSLFDFMTINTGMCFLSSICLSSCGSRMNIHQLPNTRTTVMEIRILTKLTKSYSGSMRGPVLDNWCPSLCPIPICCLIDLGSFLVCFYLY